MRTFLTAMVLALPAVARAQIPTIEPGATVRVETESERRVGTLKSQSRDTLVVVSGSGRERHIAVARITQLDRSSGRTARRGAQKGLGMGAAMGFGWSAVFYGAAKLGSDLICNSCTEQPTTTEFIGGLGKGALIGGLIGVSIGSAVGAHEWVRVRPASARPVAKRLANGRLGVGLSMTF